jgi:hypothetical protein
MEGMNFIRFPDGINLYGMEIDRKEENFYNEGCPKDWDAPYFADTKKNKRME